MPIPGAQKTWSRDPDVQIFGFEFLKAIGALALVCFTVPRLFEDGRPLTAIGTLVFAGIVFLASALSAAASLLQKRQKSSLHDLEGCFHMLYAVLRAASEEPDDRFAGPGLRVTMHVPVQQRSGEVLLEQAFDYISDDSRRRTGKGRRFSPHAGLIGEVFRLGRIGVVERFDPSYESFLFDMTSQWGYSHHEARTLDGTVMSYMAVPLSSAERGVEAILYLDCQRRRFFTKTRQELVEGAAAGIALFVGRRYT